MDRTVSYTAERLSNCDHPHELLIGSYLHGMQPQSSKAMQNVPQSQIDYPNQLRTKHGYQTLLADYCLLMRALQIKKPGRWN